MVPCHRRPPPVCAGQSRHGSQLNVDVDHSGSYTFGPGFFGPILGKRSCWKMALLHSIWRNARIRFPAITTAACFICGQRSEMPCRGFCKLKLRTGRFDLPCNEWAGEAFEVGDLSGMRPPISSTRKMGRIAYEQKLRRALERHFPKFKITRLTRQETQSSIDASLTVAIVWLDVCRKAQAGPLRCASLRSRNVRALPRKDRCRPLRIAFTGANRESRYFRLWKGQCPRPPPFPARKYRRAAIPPSCQHHWPPELDWTPAAD